ncbi:RING-type E3 ubiquitin transferase [Heracleum sosnowskyi]|uniref:E3 ubiquitin-protein ligase RMA n=1 Tax=Heracleum sosnowskyi TaxID=360622 RepID=A0AAD8IN78_9APIA|nr:RING-type E3 ubiquitin transferase [Heracleum sosnowskyi]
MATEQYFQETLTSSDSTESDGTFLQKCSSGYVTEDKVGQGTSEGFNCNICLDFVQDPVVTFCGHLYCWPCIYKWIHYQSVSAEKLDQQQPQCPVCKAVVSKETLVPLYGRGRTTKPSEAKPPHLGLVIPQRPSTPRCGSQTRSTTPSMQPTQQFQNRQHQNQHWPYYSMPGSYSATPMLSLNSSRTSTSPMVGVFGEMVYARLFGISETTLYNTDSYNIITNSNPRLRRQVMEADKSLGRLLFFLCCCLILCLFLF